MPETGSGKLAASEGVENVQKSSLADIITKKMNMFKACVRYFLRNFYSPNDRSSKTIKYVFYFN